jgi:hypothetical protein
MFIIKIYSRFYGNWNWGEKRKWIHTETAEPVFLHQWFYIPLLGPDRSFSFSPIHKRYDPLDGGSARRKACTHTQNSTNTEKNACRHPCLEWDSNPRPQCSRVRATARPLWSANRCSCPPINNAKRTGRHIPVSNMNKRARTSSLAFSWQPFQRVGNSVGYVDTAPWRVGNGVFSLGTEQAREKHFSSNSSQTTLHFCHAHTRNHVHFMSRPCKGQWQWWYDGWWLMDEFGCGNKKLWCNFKHSWQVALIVKGKNIHSFKSILRNVSIYRPNITAINWDIMCSFQLTPWNN